MKMLFELELSTLHLLSNLCSMIKIVQILFFSMNWVLAVASQEFK